MEAIYGTPIKLTHDYRLGRSSYKFFENYNIKCLMNDIDLNDKENITSGNKETGRKINSPMSQYKYIYKIIHTSTVLKQSPASAKKLAPQKLCSIVSLDCIENLNSKFDSAENSNSNCGNIGFTEFIDHMRGDSTYANYFTQGDAPETKNISELTVDDYFDGEGKKKVFNNIVSKLMHLLN